MPRKPVQHDRRRALYASTAWLVGPLLPMSSALARALIDGTDPAIEALSASLIEGRETPRERAVAIHDHVRDELRFGFTPQMYAMSAPDVLRAFPPISNTTVNNIPTVKIPPFSWGR